MDHSPRRAPGKSDGSGISEEHALKEQLQADLTDAMRARDDVKVATLRMALAAVTRAEVAGKEHVTLSEADVTGVLRGEIKRRHEAADLYDTAGRPDRAARERAEAAVLATYLPPELDDATLAAIVREEGAGRCGQGGAGTRRRRCRRGADRRGGEDRARPRLKPVGAVSVEPETPRQLVGAIPVTGAPARVGPVVCR